MRRKGRGAPVRNVSTWPEQVRRRVLEEGEFQGYGFREWSSWEVGGVQRALTFLDVVAEASQGCLGSHDSWAQAFAATSASVPSPAHRCIGEVSDGVLVTYC